mgnify:CR=1 FL=1
MSAGRAKRWGRRAAEVGVVLLVVAAARSWQARDAAAGEAPVLQGATLDGAPFALAEALAEGPVVVHFWATWCGVCRAEEGSIAALAEDLPMITVASRSGTPEAVRAELEERGRSFATLTDPDARLASAWGVAAYPTTFVVDRDGRVASVDVGFTPAPWLRLRHWLAR